MGAIMGYISVSGTGFAARTTASALSRARLPALLASALLLIGAAPVARLDVSFDQVRSTKGFLRVCVTTDPANFPRCVNDNNATKRTVPADTRSLSVEGLPHGDYAVAVIHDENGNAKLDTFAGIPKEGFGFSRNPAIGFGPPRFSAARFSIEGDAEAQQVKLRYIL